MGTSAKKRPAIHAGLMYPGVQSTPGMGSTRSAAGSAGGGAQQMLFEVHTVAVGGSAVGIFDEHVAGILPDVPGPAQVRSAGLVGPRQQLRFERRAGRAGGILIAALGD